MKITYTFPLVIVLLILLSFMVACTDAEPHDNGSVSVSIENQTVLIPTISANGGQDDFSNSNGNLLSTEIVPMDNFINPIDFSDVSINIENIKIIGSLIYIPVLCDGLYDEYIYDIDTKKGSYMSGAESLCSEYDDLITTIQNNQQVFYLNCIVSLNKNLSAAIIRKSKIEDYLDGKYLSGEYYVFDFITNSCNYICDSYPNYTSSIPGTRIESIDWVSNDSVRIYTYDRNNEFCIYNAHRNADVWTISTGNDANQ